MVRRYDEVVDVRAAVGEDGVVTPAAFVWRGRLYVVRAVLARWHERRAWWREAAASALLGLRADEAPPATPPTGSPATPPAAAVSRVATAALTGECEVWRVEAAAGRSSPVGAYDLVRSSDGADHTWHLARVAD